MFEDLTDSATFGRARPRPTSGSSVVYPWSAHSDGAPGCSS